MHGLTATFFTVLLLGTFAPLVTADCCTVDDPIADFRQCSSQVVQADKQFLVKAINYTRYHDDLGGGRFDPNPAWNSIAVWLARDSNRQCEPGDSSCNVSGPVCKLIDCLPLCQTSDCASLGGGVVITNFTTSIPSGVGPDGHYYDLATMRFDRFNTTKILTESSWRQDSYQDSSSSLQYDNNYIGFNMTDMTPQDGTDASGFYPFELNDDFGHSWPTFELREVPCRAYACARKCVNVAVGNTPASQASKSAIQQAKSCIDQCEGVDDIVNYCPDLGGTKQTITPQQIGLNSQAAFDSYIPDGCVVAESAAFPAAYASYSSSTASVARATYSAARAASATPRPSNGAVVHREVGKLIAIPFIVKVLVSL